MMLNDYEALSLGPALCFPTPNRSVSGVSHDTAQEQEKGEVGRQPRDTGDGRGLESGREAPPARGGGSSVPSGPGTSGHANDWSRPAPH